MVADVGRYFELDANVSMLTCSQRQCKHAHFIWAFEPLGLFAGVVIVGGFEQKRQRCHYRSVPAQSDSLFYFLLVDY